MARIIGIDYGQKRCGIAAADPLQIIVSAVDTVATIDLLMFLDHYLASEKVEKIVLGRPVHSDGTETALVKDIDDFVGKLSKKYPDMNIDFADEQFSSFEAKQVILARGTKKKQRQDKALVDRVSAVIILQKYLKHI